MSTSINPLWLALTVVAAFGPSAAAEQIDNPNYGYWAKFKVESVLKTRTESTTAGQTITLDMTSTLLEVTAEKITVEVKVEGTGRYRQRRSVDRQCSWLTLDSLRRR